MAHETEITIDDLAVMVQNGFLEMGDRIDGVRIELKTDIQSVRTELKEEIQDVRSELKTEIQSVRTELTEFRQETADRFDRIDKKLDATIGVTDRLDQRTTRLEKTVGLPPFEVATTV